ncbi:hypothetical protein LOAG_09399 [Loa loa]|uniref:Uncharacterized protein n=1 Tax=Loa loa TaxID=7209 RepID=A0A1S0TRZ1_LOALO|nr:hypothetical protein LOAG_09399 [Loa loa]EFO19099.1 hypothetical protein LOAG_09399 [Loa loa]
MNFENFMPNFPDTIGGWEKRKTVKTDESKEQKRAEEDNTAKNEKIKPKTAVENSLITSSTATVDSTATGKIQLELGKTCEIAPITTTLKLKDTSKCDKKITDDKKETNNSGKMKVGKKVTRK